MIDNAALNFKSELSLEEFVWENLEELLNLTPIARQYYIEGQLCDILATTSNRQLVGCGQNQLVGASTQRFKRLTGMTPKQVR